MDAYDKAIKLLSIREHTEKEIRQKLKERGCSASDIDEAVERIKAEGSLSEERFAASFLRSRLRKNPEGKSILRMRLKEKGSPRDVAEAALNEIWENEDYVRPLSVALDSLIRKKGKEGAFAALLRKGWKDSEIRQALSLLDSDISECE